MGTKTSFLITDEDDDIPENIFISLFIDSLHLSSLVRSFYSMLSMLVLYDDHVNKLTLKNMTGRICAQLIQRLQLNPSFKINLNKNW
ncbi:CLUMA_CG000801, isoform A [Clunio marinus]|uniref:CLUMA_CG000801, isoform A n=1 Tax=Clunio marinus TaxID=568069 RepID=A0A1J1HHU8_9DIPT|nr:CLUMA_CG000801, isoform A [Clunio marinus]